MRLHPVVGERITTGGRPHGPVPFELRRRRMSGPRRESSFLHQRAQAFTPMIVHRQVHPGKHDLMEPFPSNCNARFHHRIGIQIHRPAPGDMPCSRRRRCRTHPVSSDRRGYGRRMSWHRTRSGPSLLHDRNVRRQAGPFLRPSRFPRRKEAQADLPCGPTSRRRHWGTMRRVHQRSAGRNSRGYHRAVWANSGSPPALLLCLAGHRTGVDDVQVRSITFRNEGESRLRTRRPPPRFPPGSDGIQRVYQQSHVSVLSVPA
jgi:hypothetical protein